MVAINAVARALVALNGVCPGVSALDDYLLLLVSNVDYYTAIEEIPVPEGFEEFKKIMVENKDLMIEVLKSATKIQFVDLLSVRQD